MADWNLGRVFRVVAAFYIGDWKFALSQLLRESGAATASRQNRRAQQAYNDAQKDRLEMLDLQPRAARTLALGRVRTVEGVRRRWTSGTNSDKLTMIVSFAGHEIDGFEQWYLDDVPVTLDAQGWVTTAPYGASVLVDKQASGTLNGSGAATVTMDAAPAGAVYAVWATGSGDSLAQGACAVSVSGATATITGGQPGAAFTLSYATSDAIQRVRIRPYLGTASQNVGADLASEYPGKLTSTDRFAGIALAVVDVVFDPDVFPQGRPTVTAVFRGAKVLDPRDGVTRWTDNPALQAYYFATWQHGGGVPADEISTADVIAAADVCDASTVYTLGLTGGGTELHTLPRYRCGAVLASDADPASNMATIVSSMAGRVGWSGGVLRMRAGAVRAAVAEITPEWLMLPAGDGDNSGAVITGTQSVNRAARINRVSGECIDPAQRYQSLPYPAVEDAVLIAAKGEREADISFPGVNHIAHAQNLARIAIRETQAGLRVSLQCGLQALGLQLGDFVTLSLPRFGIASKLFEVVGWSWDLAGPIKLQLQETAAAIFDPTAPLTGRDPAPDSTLRRPWDVEALSGLAVASGTTPTLDGSIMTRTVITLDAAVGASIRQGGQIEVQYTEAGAALPTGEWPSWIEAGTATKVVIPGLLQGRHYLFRARAVQPLPLVRGPWTATVLHQVAAVRVPRIYRQASAPTAGLVVGDEWYDTDDGNAHYVREAAGWVSVRDSGIAAALDAAADAQATADGKIDTFYQATAPTGASEGDIWFDTDDGNRQYRHTGGSWVGAADTRIGTAITAAADAQATADGRVSTFIGGTPPTAEAVGDLWLNTDDGNRLYRWAGTAWVALPVGTGGLAPSSATEVFIDSGGAGSVGENPSATSTNKNVVLRTASFTNSTGAAISMQFEGGLTNSTLSFNSTYPSGTKKATLEWSSSSMASAFVLCSTWPDMSQPGAAPLSPIGINQVLLPAGETLTVALRVELVHTAAASISFSSSFIRLTAIKR